MRVVDILPRCNGFDVQHRNVVKFLLMVRSVSNLDIMPNESLACESSGLVRTGWVARHECDLGGGRSPNMPSGLAGKGRVTVASIWPYSEPLEDKHIMRMWSLLWFCHSPDEITLKNEWHDWFHLPISSSFDETFKINVGESLKRNAHAGFGQEKWYTGAILASWVGC